jgi:hypothetical protein
MIEKSRTPVSVIVVAWLAVSLPAAWGIYNTVLNALKLFQRPVAVSSPQAEPSHAK